DMVRVARRAYADVADEVDARVDVPVSRARVKGAYLDRLARSDVGPALAVALDHRDADLPELLIAIGELLADIPPELLERSDPTFRRIVAAPLRSWSSLSPASRTAYRAIARTTLDREHARGARPARHGWSFAPALVAVDRLGLQRGAPLAAIWLRTAAGVRSVVGRLLGRKPATRRDVTPVER
ncbi:MAG TPA: hypothetical protein VF119_00820, partial [Candidatus Limnocylindrales bacterium]